MAGRKSGKKAPEAEAANVEVAENTADETAAKKDYSKNQWIHGIKNENIKMNPNYGKDPDSKQPYAFVNKIALKMEDGTTAYANMMVNSPAQMPKFDVKNPEGRTDVLVGRAGQNVSVNFDNAKKLCEKGEDGNYTVKDAFKDTLNATKFDEQTYTGSDGKEHTSLKVRGTMKADFIAEAHNAAIKEYAASQKAKESKTIKHTGPEDPSDGAEDQVELG